MSKKITRAATGVVLVAIATVLGLQSYSLHRVHEKLDARIASRDPEQQTAQKPATASQPSPGKNDSDLLPGLRSASPWDPFREMEDMQARIDDFFQHPLGYRSFTDPTVPRVDLTDGDGEYVVRVDLPGSDRSSFEVSLEDRSLRIQADRSEDVEEQEPGPYVRRERRSGHFERRLTLPGPVDSQILTSDYANGVLTIRVHKA